KKIVPKLFDKSLISNYNKIFSIAESNNKLFLAVLHGIVEYDLITGKENLINNFREKGKEEITIISQLYIQPSDPNILWITTIDEGFIKYNLTDYSYRKIYKKKKDVYNSLQCVLEDKDKNIWGGSHSLGLLKYNPMNDSTIEFKLPKSKYKKNTIQVLHEDKRGHIWAGSSHEGLYKYDKGKDSLLKFKFSCLDSLEAKFSVFVIKEDKNNNLWVGTSKGLLKYNYVKNESAWYTYSSAIGVHPILAIELDENNNVWFSSFYEIGRFDINKKIFSVYPGEKKQISQGYMPDCSVALPDGRKIFGGDWSFTAIDPSQLNTVVPNIVITKLHLADHPSIFDYHIDPQNPISLEYYENYFSIEFDALSFTAPERNKFIYKLDGYDKEWIEASSDKIVRYANVEPRDYIFRVKGSNCDGVWNEEGANLAITVLPPYYKTTWAYILYFIILILVVYAIVRFFLYKARLQNEAVMRQREAEQLQQLDQIKSRFFANISHELRTPLTLILGPLESLTSKEAGSTTFQMMHKQAKKLLNMINQLLDISRLESGKMRLKISKRDVVKHTQAIIESFYSLAQNKKIQLKFTSSLSELTTYYDTDKYEKIIINLLSNAFKFSPDEEDLIVSLQASAAAEFNGLRFSEGYFCIKVKDNGVGIPSEDAKKVFDRFYQVEKNSKIKFGGTGLGLSIVKDFVDMHNGLVFVNPDVEKGTEFNVVLPLGKNSFQDAEFEEYADDEKTSDSIDFIEDHVKIEVEEIEKQQEKDHSLKNILIIEDHQEVNDYIKNILMPAYSVVQTYDGETGVISAKKFVPDLVVCDIMMPGIDGYEVCQQLKTDEITSHIPIILLTAKASMNSKIDGLETGADDYITKPFSEDELKIRIKNLIKNRETLRSKFAGQINLNPKELSITPVDEKFFIRVKVIVEQNLKNPDFSVDNFAVEIGMSRMTLHRKLKAVTGISTKELIQEMRLRKAAQLLEKNFGSIAEVAYEVGFKEPSYFTKCFQKKYNVVPSVYNQQQVRRN
ncbi:MAG: response regulator, partial [Ignavibacteriaceae bacterium]|nr:response regulator [Ignavibacteriaceae bacterium]